MPTAVTVVSPATSANLGPGFDSLGMALAGIADEVTVELTSGGLAVDVVGEGAGDLPRDERHLVVRAVRAGLAATGLHPAGMRIRSTNRIPHARGLGSSAAAVAGGLVAAFALAGRDVGEQSTLLRLLELATEFEGHPDNVAPCLFGGVTVAWVRGDGRPGAVRLPVDAVPGPVVFVPAHTSLTAHARRLLPDMVPHRDAAANVGRAALLVAALTGRPDVLFDATEDWLHQRYRATAMPASTALVATLRAAGIPAVISGAGPTVLAFATSLAGIAGVPPTGFTVVESAVQPTGVRLVA